MTKCVYQVAGLFGSKFFATKEDLLYMYEQTGENFSGRSELIGQPRVKGFVGPMYNGQIKPDTRSWYDIPFPVEDGTHVIRFETAELYSTFK